VVVVTAYSLEIVGNSLSALVPSTSEGIDHIKMAPSPPTDTIVLWSGLITI
jgi:hypothetical protein